MCRVRVTPVVAIHVSVRECGDDACPLAEFACCADDMFVTDKAAPATLAGVQMPDGLRRGGVEFLVVVGAAEGQGASPVWARQP